MRCRCAILTGCSCFSLLALRSLRSGVAFGPLWTCISFRTLFTLWAYISFRTLFTLWACISFRTLFTLWACISFFSFKRRKLFSCEIGICECITLWPFLANRSLHSCVTFWTLWTCITFRSLRTCVTFRTLWTYVTSVSFRPLRAGVTFRTLWANWHIRKRQLALNICTTINVPN